MIGIDEKEDMIEDITAEVVVEDSMVELELSSS